jgi:hypothetical protein
VTRADRIEVAARALLADLEDLSGSPLCVCGVCSDALAARKADGETFCDPCFVRYEADNPNPARVSGSLSYAHAIRALRAALAEVP